MKKEKLSANILFSGIGCQERGFQNSNLFDLEVLNTSDICKESVLSYAAIHCGLTNEMVENYPDYPSREEMAKELTEINLGYEPEKDKPFDWAKLVKRKNKDLEKYWLANKLSHNLGDISKIEELPYADLWTCSFCCQDISVAGKMKGLNPDSGTRSSLLWENIRLLKKARDNNISPKYIMFENVKNLVSKRFIDDFNNLLEVLDELGFNSYWKVLNAKECGIPQNRERVFVISIRKDIDKHTFDFPVPFDNGLRLKDTLEEVVDEKYYLSDDKVEKFKKNFNVGDSSFTTRNSDIVSCIRATYYKNGSRNICENIENGKGYEGVVEVSPNREYKIGNVYNSKHTGGSFTGNVYDKKGLYPALSTMQGGGRQPHIVTNATIGIDKSINDTQMIEYANCITAREDRGVSNRKSEGTAIMESQNDIRIRKLTPRECYVLMGLTFEDCDKAAEIGVSNTHLYKQAGNGIVANCCELIAEHLYKAQYDNTYVCTDEKMVNFINPQPE